MDKEKTADAVPHLSMSVIVEILIRLPLKSAVRFSTVCKQWYSAIQTPYFARQQWDYGTRDSKIFVVNTRLAEDDELGRNALCVYSFSEDGGRIMLSDTFAIPVEVKDDFTVSNSCHGLISLYGARCVYVANPFMKKFRALKEATFHQSRVHDDELIFPNVGVGFSIETAEYKVARVSGPERRCEVLTLGKDQSWRDIGAVPAPLSGYKPAYLNGALYWTTLEQEGPERIVRFDVSKEEFTVIKIPPSWFLEPSTEERRLYPAVLWGSLCLAVWCAPLLDFHVIDDKSSMWAGNHSNIRSRRIEARLDMQCINSVDWIEEMVAVGIHKDKILVFCEHSKDWVFHDLQSNASSFIRLSDEPFLSSYSRPFACEESLLDLP